MFPLFTCKEGPGSCWLRVHASGQVHSEAFSSRSCFVKPGTQAPNQAWFCHFYPFSTRLNMQDSGHSVQGHNPWSTDNTLSGQASNSLKLAVPSLAAPRNHPGRGYG